MGKKTRIDELRPSQAVRKRRTRTLFFDLATLDRSTNRNRAMKYSSALLLFSSSSADSPLARTRRQAPDQDARRYKQLTAQMQYYNADFDERKYWTYGCQCLILGDRPMSDPGHGPPIDELDSVCKQYKDCQKCARMRHGEFCIGEFVEYGLRWNRNSGAPVCKDAEGSCGRALCECDRQFAINHVAKKDVFNIDYHMFWTTTGFDSNIQCVSTPGPKPDPQCCNNPAGPYTLYNANTKQCCDNYEVKPNSDTC